MSYSVCASCEKMVSCYEKYCPECLRRWPHLKQIVDFWKHYTGSYEAAKEMARTEKSELGKGK